MHDSGSGVDFSLPYSHVSVGELLRQAGLVCSRRLEPFKLHLQQFENLLQQFVSAILLSDLLKL